MANFRICSLVILGRTLAIISTTCTDRTLRHRKVWEQPKAMQLVRVEWGWNASTHTFNLTTTQLRLTMRHRRSSLQAR